MIVYSALNNLVQVHSFGENPSSSLAPVACSDPSLLDLGLDQSVRISKLHIQPMQREDMPADISFFRLFVTQSDGGLQELVVCSSSFASTRSDPVVKDFEQSIVKHPRAGISRIDLGKDDDSFVVPNRLEVADTPRPKITSQIPRLRPTSGTVPARYLRDQRLIVAPLLRLETVDETSHQVDVVQTISEVQQILIDGLDFISRPLGTL